MSGTLCADFSNGWKSRYEFFQALEKPRITNVLNHISDETISSFGYTLNDADQRTRIQRNGYTIDYGYDAIGQLRSAQAKYNDGTICYRPN